MSGRFISHANTANSPKAEFYENWSRWFIENDVAKILDALDPDVEWEMVGEPLIRGIEEVRNAFFGQSHQVDHTMNEMQIDQIVSHGKNVCGWGTMQMSDGIRYRYCDILEFTSHKPDAKVKKVIAFVMETEE